MLTVDFVYSSTQSLIFVMKERFKNRQIENAKKEPTQLELLEITKSSSKNSSNVFFWALFSGVFVSLRMDGNTIQEDEGGVKVTLVYQTSTTSVDFEPF